MRTIRCIYMCSLCTKFGGLVISGFAHFVLFYFWLKEFMQVEFDEVYICIKFCACGLLGFGDLTPSKWPDFPC